MVFERRWDLWRRDNGVLRPTDPTDGIEVSADIVAQTVTITGESVVQQGVANRHEVVDADGLRVHDANGKKWALQVSTTGQPSYVPVE